MKKFLVILVIFGTGLLGLAFVADFVITKRLQKSTTRMLVVWNDIYSGNLQHDVLIMGNSRAWTQYSPQILDSILGVNSYNIGIDGSHFNRQILRYDTYRRFNTTPKAIIQNIDFATLGITTGLEREQFFPYFFDDSLKTESSKYENFNILEKYVPAYRYIGYSSMIQEGIKLVGDKADIKKGYFGIDKPWDGTIFHEVTEFEHGQDSLILSLFDQYLSKANSENIRVIFVYAPMYIGATKKLKNEEGMFIMFDSIAQKYNIPVLNYNYDPISYDSLNFYNATHLNRKNAELFSAKLAHDIDSLGIFKTEKK